VLAEDLLDLGDFIVRLFCDLKEFARPLGVKVTSLAARGEIAAQPHRNRTRRHLGDACRHAPVNRSQST